MAAATAAHRRMRTGSSVPSMAEAWEESFLDKSEVPIVKKMVRVLTEAKMAQGPFRNLLQKAIQFNLDRELPEKVAIALASDATANALFSGMHTVIASAVRNHVKDSIVQANLAAVGFPESHLKDLCMALSSRQDAIALSNVLNRIKLPALEGLRWRVDVTISTTSMTRVFKPTVTMQMTLTDGTIRSFEVSVEQFHALRYNVAKLVKNTDTILTANPILKLK